MDEYFDNNDFESLLEDLSTDANCNTTSEDDSTVSDLSEPNTPVYGKQQNKSPCVLKPRRNRYNPEPVPNEGQTIVVKPKILRSDIRRSYAMMLANVINSGDFPLMYGMLDTFFLPDFEQHVIKRNPEDEGFAPTVRKGVDQVAAMFYAVMHMDPDPLVKIEETKVHLISNSSCSRIVSKFRYSATSIYQSSNDAECPKREENERVTQAENNMQLQQTNNGTHKRKECGDNLIDKSIIMMMIQKSIEDIKLTLPLRSEPLPYSFGGAVTLYTDENKFITKIEMEMDSKPEQLKPVFHQL